MKPIILAMLAVQAAIILVTFWTVLFRRETPGDNRPVWSGLVFVMLITAGTSTRIANSHAGQPGTDFLATGAPLLIGMAVMGVLIMLRQRRGLS
jgi:hypothetical protein